MKCNFIDSEVTEVVTAAAEEDTGPVTVEDSAEDLECRVPVVVVSIEDGKANVLFSSFV